MATNRVKYRQKFQYLLRELFQLDSAKDLDFGIYRILNYRRDVVERFIEKDLLDAVSAELARGALAEQAGAARDLETLAAKVRAELGDAALDAGGVLADAYCDTPLGRKYLEVFELARGAKTRPETEAAIFNHLYAFFNRYYDAGDFMSKRRYSKREKYAIPYNGEEVYLHWANRDQYYVKTAEYFTDYSFRAPGGVTVHFKLQAADVEKDNVKGDRRFFVPIVKDATLDADEPEVVIPFEYRPLTEQEKIKYGTRNQQEAIIEEALEAIPKHFAREAVAAAALADVETHLRRYTARNTSDYFIHKYLKGFLERELDFYLKNEVVNVDELEAGGEARADAWFQQMRVIKAIGRKVIAFLAQIEDFQKMLFEKKKFILETQYCITVQNIPESFYTEIAANDAQWDEWRDLFHIDEEEKNLFNASAKSKMERRVAFLKSHPTLVLDTKHFDGIFNDRLIDTFNTLDSTIDGLLLLSENFQGLSLLIDRYSEEVNSIYIDPPYNTDASAIIYKNDYKDSSWLSLIENRLNIASQILIPEGIICIAIDDEEASRLRLFSLTIFEKDLGVIVVRSNPAGRKTKGRFAPAHEYAMFFSKSKKSAPISLGISESRLRRFPLTDEKGNFAWANFIRSGSGDKREDRPTMYYPIYVSNKNSIRIPKMEWDENTNGYTILEPTLEGEVAVYPNIKQRDKIIEKRWQRGYERVVNELEEYRVRRSATGEIFIDFKTRIDISALPTTWWDKKEYASANYGAAELKELFGVKVFDFAKARRLVEDCVSVCSNVDDEPMILDYFAGSGTTGDAVIGLNRKDGGFRKFILIEMGQYFNTVLLPRIKKVTFTPEWSDGKPKRLPTYEEAERTPRIIKYLRLETYEDALNNIFFYDAAAQSAIVFDDYVLKYMLSWETKDSATFLNVAQLEDPFNYKLLVTENGVTVEKPVDLPETFNYLLGLQVATRKVYNDEGRKYLIYKGTTRDDRSVAVIWRVTKGWTEADYERDRAFVASEKITDGADDIYVNAVSVIPGAKSLDPIFKARMFAPLDSSNGGV